jgi:hypothetical protein
MTTITLPPTPFAPPYYPLFLDRTNCGDSKYWGKFAWQSSFENAFVYHYIINFNQYKQLRSFNFEEPSWLMKIYTSYGAAIKDVSLLNMPVLEDSPYQ